MWALRTCFRSWWASSLENTLADENAPEARENSRGVIARPRPSGVGHMGQLRTKTVSDDLSSESKGNSQVLTILLVVSTTLTGPRTVGLERVRNRQKHTGDRRLTLWSSQSTPATAQEMQWMMVDICTRSVTYGYRQEKRGITHNAVVAVAVVAAVVVAAAATGCRRKRNGVIKRQTAPLCWQPSKQ